MDPLYYLIPMALIAGVVALQFHLIARRRRLLKEAAASLGFTYTATDVGASVGGLPHPLFQRGYDDKVSNVLDGSASGVRARLFDYQYTTGGGKNRSRHHQTVAAFQLTQSTLPDFEMFPERFYHWFAEAAGYKDIDFDSDPAFSRSYRLLGADEHAVRRLFHPGVVAPWGTRPGWTVEGSGQTLLFYRPRVIVKPDDVAGFLSETRELVRLFGVR